MNLYLRLIGLLIRLFFSKRQTPLDLTQRTFRVWPNDLDLNLHVNNGRYLTLMDLGRLDLMCKVNLWRPALKKGWMPVLGNATIQYIRPLLCFQKFTLTTQVIYWDEKWIYLEQKFFHQNRLAAHAYVRALFLQKKNKITPQEVMDTFGLELIKPAPPKALLDWIASENASLKQVA